MTKETYDKAHHLMGKICCRKGHITVLHQKLAATKDVLKREDIEKKIKDNVELLDNLRKEFKNL